MRVGIDIIEISRFENMSQDINKLQTIFTNKEIDYFNKFKNKLEHIAGCFCAKEAVCKAFKTGFNANITPLCIEIVHDNNVPNVVLKGGAKELYLSNNYKDIQISISHNKTMATAICIII